MNIEIEELNYENSSDEVTEKPLELCIAALKYLHQCSGILGSMYTMPACPAFHAAHR